MTTLLSDGKRIWFGPQAPLSLRFLLPDGTPVPDDTDLRHTPSFYRLQRRTFANEKEALACCGSTS